MGRTKTPDKLSSNKTVEIEGEVVHETEKAILFNVDGIEEWVPKSQIEEEDFEAGDQGLFGVCMTITIPEWLAKVKGWSE